MDQSEKIEIFKAILSKNIPPNAVANAYKNYKKAVRMIEKPEERPRVPCRMICDSCLAGHHEECSGFLWAVVRKAGQTSATRIKSRCFCPICNSED